MKRIIGATLAAILPVPSLSSPAFANQLPDAIAAMIDSALATKDPATVAAVVSVAKRTAPENVADIDAMVVDHDRMVAAQAAEKAQAERERLANAGMLSLWKGQFELGGSWSTGNTRSLGLYGAAKATREGLDWQHDISARIDYQETNRIPTTERAVAAYQPRYKFDQTFYAYGLEQYEHDRFLGYRNRLTSGVGLGVVAASGPELHLEFDLGPAFRYTEYYGPDMGREQRIAGRGGLSLKWIPWPSVTVAQDAAVYVQKGNTTATSTTSIDTRLFGPVKGRLSYNVQYERDAPDGQKTTDTVSRASIVYSF